MDATATPALDVCIDMWPCAASCHVMSSGARENAHMGVARRLNTVSITLGDLNVCWEPLLVARLLHLTAGVIKSRVVAARLMHQRAGCPAGVMDPSSPSNDPARSDIPVSTSSPPPPVRPCTLRRSHVDFSSDASDQISAPRDVPALTVDTGALSVELRWGGRCVTEVRAESSSTVIAGKAAT